MEQVSCGLHGGGSLSQQWPLCHIKIQHSKSAGGQCVPLSPAAIVRVSGAPAFLTTTLAPSRVRIIAGVFVEASCEPKSTAVTKSASRASSANVGDTSHQHLKK